MSTTTISRRSEDTAARAAGTLLGHAVGDALGLGTEFLSRERVAEWYPRGLLDYDAIVRDPHRRKWKPGESTDDTGQMLALADVLAEHGDGPTFEAAFARALDAWVRRDARGIGKLTVRVLCNRDYLADPLGTARAAAARLGDGAASNGSLMRVTPAGVAFWDDPKRAAAMGARSSLVSHSDPRCVDACRVVAACVAALVGGAAVDDAWACAAA